jgi:hypothetical protein
MVIDNSELDAVVQSIDERYLIDAEEKVKEKFQWDAEGSLIGLLSSRNARPEKALVVRAQLETDSGSPPGRDIRECGGTIRVVVRCAE